MVVVGVVVEEPPKSNDGFELIEVVFVVEVVSNDGATNDTTAATSGSFPLLISCATLAPFEIRNLAV